MRPGSLVRELAPLAKWSIFYWHLLSCSRRQMGSATKSPATPARIWRKLNANPL